MKHRFVRFTVKSLIVIAIFGFLVWKAAAATDENGHNVFTILWEQPKRWDLLAGSFLVQLFAASLTFVRWRWLVRSLGMELSLYDAQRLGFFGLFLNLTPLGIVGGDAAKAYFLGQHNVNCRTQAFASVIVDRLLGLLMMFVFASVTAMMTGFAFEKNTLAQTLTYTVFTLTAAGLIGLGFVFTPVLNGLSETACGKTFFHRIWNVFAKLVQAMLVYRHHKRCLAAAFMFSFVNHLLASVSLYWAAKGCFADTPGFLHHSMLYSVLNLALLIPVAGPFELVFDQIYTQVYDLHIGIGLVVALVYRVITTLVCCAGAVFAVDRKQSTKQFRN